MGALDGIRVIEIANWAAAPSTGALFVEQGAEVIKIEPLAGDGMRGLMHQASGQDPDHAIDHAFHFSNRGKKSVAIALDLPRGQDVALALIAEADVVVTNLLAQRRQRFALTVDAMREINPQLIVGVLTGFGDVGPDAQTPGFDLTAFFARSGLSASVGGFDGAPPRWRAAQGDHVAGLSLYGAIVTALVKRGATGEGAVVETSLFASAAWSNAFDLTRAAADAKPSRAKTRERSANVTSEAYRCADGRFVQLSLAEPTSGWRIMCEVLELGELEHDERFSTTVARFANMADCIALFDERIATHNSDDLVQAITERGGVAAVVMQSNDVVLDAQSRAIALLRPVDVDGATIEVVNAPFSIDRGDPDLPMIPVTGIGEPGADTAEVLGSILDLNADEVSQLEAEGVIRVAASST